MYRLRPLTTGWVNAYRARDVLGRAVMSDPLDAADQPRLLRQGAGTRWAIPVGLQGLVPHVDVCLHGGGGHTGYWDDPELAVWLDHLVRRASGEAIGDPPGYAVADA